MFIFNPTIQFMVETPVGQMYNAAAIDNPGAEPVPVPQEHKNEVWPNVFMDLELLVEARGSKQLSGL